MDDSGGAIFIGDVDYEDSVQQVNLINPEIINCTFRENWATNFGGAILKQGKLEALIHLKFNNVSLNRMNHSSVMVALCTFHPQSHLIL